MKKTNVEKQSANTDKNKENKNDISWYHKLIEGLYGASLEYFVNWRLHVSELMVALAIVLVFRSMVGVVYSIPTGSMIPTFKEGDVLVANRFYYGLKLPFTMGKKGYRLPAIKEIDVGDVIIFRAPLEEVFYFAFVAIKESEKEEVQKQLAFLNTLNKESSFLRPLSVRVYEEELSWLESSHNYIFENVGEETFGLRLHKDVYHKYKQALEEQFRVISVIARRSTLSFETKVEEGFFSQVYQPFFSASSILTSVFMNVPFMALYKYAYLRFFLQDTVQPFNLKNSKVSFYPNNYIPVHKEYVKRVIAKEGDTVELRNKRVYINGEALPLSRSGVDPGSAGDAYYLFSEGLPQSKKKTDGADMFRHPVRLSTSQIEVAAGLQKDWPYSPQSMYAAQFRDTFGPVTVPSDHFFVMGDNRDESLDSRYIGFVPNWEVTGTPMFVFLPLARAGLVR